MERLRRALVSADDAFQLQVGQVGFGPPAFQFSDNFIPAPKRFEDLVPATLFPAVA